MNARRFSIGIAGPSCSGKGTVAYALANRWAEAFWESEQGVLVLSQDAYYVDLRVLPFKERALRNFDEPAAFDWPLMECQLRDLLESRAIDSPVYDFATHTRREGRRTIGPAHVVIFEGLLALHSESIRNMLDLCVYLDASDEECLERRI